MAARLLSPLTIARGGARLTVLALKLGSAALGDLADALAEILDLVTPDAQLDDRRDVGRQEQPATRVPDASREAPVLEHVAAPDPEPRHAPLRREGEETHEVAALGDVALLDRPAQAPEPEQDATPELPPRHIESESVLVAESADPGAEDGAGAELHVEEPWHGYAQLKAPDIVDRLVVEPDVAVTMVLLYERANRARRTVLAAAERELAKRG